MDTNAITAKWLEKMLRQRAVLPDELLWLDFVSAFEGTPIEKKKAFYRTLEKHIQERLTYLRSEANWSTAPNQDALNAQLAADFGDKSSRDQRAWSAVYHRYFEVRFKMRVKDLQNTAGFSEAQFLRYLRQGIAFLVDFVQQCEEDIHQMQQAVQLRSRLEAPEYQQLYGNEALRHEIIQHFRQAKGAAFVSIEGIAGIGKTAMAHAVAEAVSSAGIFKDIIWISARQGKLNDSGLLETVPNTVRKMDDVLGQLMVKLGLSHFGNLPTETKLEKIAPALAHAAYFIVIDNLETLEDTQELIPALRRIAGKSRWLITSRSSLRHFRFVQSHTVPELSRKDSEQLITSLLRPGLQLSTQDYASMYEMVGGLPLALKLIASHIGYRFSASELMIYLYQTRDKNGFSRHHLLDYIYQASWDRLSASARQLLLAIQGTIPPEGDLARWVETMGYGAGLNYAQIAAAMVELENCSLLEVRCKGSECRFYLHSLTQHYLATQFETDASPTLLGRLEAASALVLSLQRQPLQLKKHIASILLLLNQASTDASLYELCIQLTLQIEQWSLYLDDWQRWENTLCWVQNAALIQKDYVAAARFLDCLAHIQLQGGRQAEAQMTVQQVMDIAQHQRNPLLFVRGFVAQVEMLFDSNLDHFEQITAELEEKFATSDWAQPPNAEVFARLEMGRALVSRRKGHLAVAVDHAEQAAEYAAECAPNLQAHTRRLAGLYRWVNADYAIAENHLKSAVQLHQALGDMYGLALAIGNLGLVYWSMGRLRSAEKLTAYTVFLAKKHHTAWQLTCQMGNVGLVHLYDGHLQKAEKALKRHRQLAFSMGFEYEIARANGNTGILQLHLGHYQQAIQLLREDARICRELKRLEALGTLYTNLAMCYAAIGDEPKAKLYAFNALKIAKTLDSSALKVLALRCLAELLPPHQARRALVRAYRLANNRHFDRAACLLRLAAFTENDHLRERYWNAAQIMLKKMGADNWLSNASIENPPLLPMIA